MKLTEEQGIRLMAVLSAQKFSQTCPLCGCQLFNASDTVMQLTECNSSIQGQQGNYMVHVKG